MSEKVYNKYRNREENVKIPFKKLNRNATIPGWWFRPEDPDEKADPVKHAEYLKNSAAFYKAEKVGGPKRWYSYSQEGQYPDLTKKQAYYYEIIKNKLEKIPGHTARLRDVAPTSPTTSIDIVSRIAGKGYLDFVGGGLGYGRFAAGHSWGDTIVSLPGTEIDVEELNAPGHL